MPNLDDINAAVLDLEGRLQGGHRDGVPGTGEFRGEEDADKLIREKASVLQ